MIKKSKNTIVLIILLILLILVTLFFVRRETKKNKQTAWNSFQSDTSKILPLGKTPDYSYARTSGCFKGEYYSLKSNCLFNYQQFYILDGGYRVNEKQIKEYLVNNGYLFKDANEQLRYERDIESNTTKDDLSNVTPVILELTNSRQGIDLKVVIGDKKRLNPGGPPGSPRNEFAKTSDNKLMATLDFGKVYTTAQ